jgi:hypothetical protein
VEEAAVSDVDVPRLESRDLEEELRPFLQAQRHSHLFAVYGTGDEQTLRFPTSPQMEVVRVRSELELRARLPPLHAEDPHMVFLVPWTVDVPLDLRGRFARDGRVIRIGRETRLKRLLGVVEVDVEAARSPLTDWLLRPSAPKLAPIREGRLTHELLWATWLKQECGVDTEGGLALDALLAWAASDGRARVFLDGAGAVPRLRDELLRVLERSLGPAGPLVWRVWEQGRGQALLELAVLFEALAGSADPAVRMWTKDRLRTDLGVTDEAALLEVPRALGGCAGAALRCLERTAGTPTARAIVRGAEDRVDDDEIRAALAPSTRLPAALETRLAALGEALATTAVTPTAMGFARARSCLHAVEGHTLAREGDGSRQVERGEMAVKLLAWLVARPDAQLPPTTAPHDDVEELGRWYAEEGGFIDWARRSARGSAASLFGRGVQAVVEAADRARCDLDRRFARALVAWTAAGQPARGVIPIDKALERLASRFLDEEGKDRRLLVLLLDGMAWAQAVELLDSLSERAWGPLAWQTSKKACTGDGMYPVMVAFIPSMTEFSRAAFFAGKPVPAGATEETRKDRDRFRENRAIARFFSGADAPTLLLGSDSQTAGGAASEAALRLVADRDQRVVALVLNAIDDSLKGNPATRHPWRVENVASLADLLDAARDAGRAVLLASDHGHVPSDRLVSLGTLPSGGARWRPLSSPADPLQECEVAFPAGRAWAPKGAWGVAVMADDTGRWGGSTHAGEHGGATLAEVVAPCVLVGPEGLEGPTPDDALRVRDPYRPAWWRLDVEGRVAVPVDAAPTPVEPARQLTFAVVEPPKPPPAPAPRRPSVTPVSPFARSRVLEAMAPDVTRRQQVVRAVDFLLARNGVATAAAFAAEMDVPLRRAGGIVAVIQEAVNVDGYQVLKFDAAGQEVSLDVEKLRQLFEVPA